MTEAPLTAERGLIAAEDVLRRFGPAKATVVDVARALGVTHGSVYRHFPSKAALHEAVAERWLHRISVPLAVVAAERGAAPARLRRWFDLLRATRRRKVADDPELFTTYSHLVAEAGHVVRGHVDELTAQIARIVQNGVDRGELDVADVPTAARAVLDATARFHNPVHASEWADPAIDAAFEGVWRLMLRGLGVTPRRAARKAVARPQ